MEFEQLLPEVPGYTEIELPEGYHTYKSIATGALIENPYHKTKAETALEKTGSIYDRLEFLEDCIAEMAMELYG